MLGRRTRCEAHITITVGWRHTSCCSQAIVLQEQPVTFSFMNITLILVSCMEKLLSNEVVLIISNQKKTRYSIILEPALANI